jgi:hypothetical protein
MNVATACPVSYHIAGRRLRDERLITVIVVFSDRSSGVDR